MKTSFAPAAAIGNLSPGTATQRRSALSSAGRASSGRCRSVIGCSAIAVLAIGAFPAARGQDALRLSIAGQTQAALRKEAAENQPYSFRLGNAKVLASASLDNEWNDNINLSSSHPQEDLILRPLSNFDITWPVTQLNSLSFSIGIGYEKFIDHSEYDRLLIAPGSALSWDVYVGDFKINVHDRFSYEQDPTAAGELSGTARFGGFYNTTGIQALWDVQKVVISLGYDHSVFLPSDTRYEYLERTSEFRVARSTIQVRPGAFAGVEVSGGPTAYTRPGLSDNFTYSAGVFAEWQVDTHLKIEPRGGYYAYHFDDNGLPNQVTEQNGYYLSIVLRHELNSKIHYSLEGGHETYFGIYSELVEQWYASARVNWNLIRHVSLYTTARYESAAQNLGPLDSGYDRTFLSVGVATPVAKRWNVRLDYRHWLKDSNLEGNGDYTQNRVTLQLAYHF